MRPILIFTCVFWRSAWLAVCRPFCEQRRRLSSLRYGSLWSALTALILAPLPALTAAPADDVAARLAQGHLSAAYCAARPEKQPAQVVGIYREIIPVAAPPGSYTTVAFAGGYVGLAGNKTAAGGDTINFSIWGKDAVHVKHENAQTIYTAWFGEAAKNEWLLAGRIGKAGTHHLGKAGGFLEHAGKKEAQVPRCTGYGTSWVHDGQRWQFCTQAEASVKDPDNARFHQRDGVIYIEIGLGLKSEKGSKFKLLDVKPIGCCSGGS